MPSRKRPIRRRWLQPSSRASEPIAARALARAQAAPSPGQLARDRAGLAKGGAKRAVDHAEATLPAVRVPDPLDQPAAHAQLVQLDHAVGQLVHRHPEQGVRAQRREAHLDAALLAGCSTRAQRSCRAATNEVWRSGRRSTESGLRISVTSPDGTSRLHSGSALHSS